MSNITYLVLLCKKTKVPQLSFFLENTELLNHIAHVSAMNDIQSLGMIAKRLPSSRHRPELQHDNDNRLYRSLSHHSILIQSFVYKPSCVAYKFRV